MKKKDMEDLIESLTPREQKQLLALCMEMMNQADVIEVITNQQTVSKGEKFRK